MWFAASMSSDGGGVASRSSSIDSIGDSCVTFCACCTTVGDGAGVDGAPLGEVCGAGTEDQTTNGAADTPWPPLGIVPVADVAATKTATATTPAETALLRMRTSTPGE